METEERICRLCFKMCSNFKSMGGDMKDVLDVLLPNVDLAAVQQPVMCKTCAGMLFKCFDFKTKCFYTHDDLVPFVKNKDSVKLNLKDIYLKKNGNSNTVPEGQSICSFCIAPVESCSVIFLENEGENAMLKKMLEQCLPELDFSNIEEPVICVPCHGSLKKYFQFVTKFLIVEEKFQKYCETLDINSRDQEELSSLIQFTRDVTNKVDGNRDDNVNGDDSESISESGMETGELDFNRFKKVLPPRTTELHRKPKCVTKNQPPKIFKCDFCTYQSKGGGAVKRHLRLHTNV